MRSFILIRINTCTNGILPQKLVSTLTFGAFLFKKSLPLTEEFSFNIKTVLKYLKILNFQILLNLTIHIQTDYIIINPNVARELIM